MIDRELDSGVMSLRLNHGAVNALDIELTEALRAALTEAKNDDAMRGVVVSGNSRVFSAGIDLKRLVSEPVAYQDHFLGQLTELFLDFLNFPKPLVTAITGHAVAGGCVLASAGDFRVISRRARIGVPELRVGVAFPVAGMEIMRWSALPARFRQMISAGATFTGAEAVEAGLADVAADPDDVAAAARRSLEELCVVPAEVFALTKRQMRYPVNQAIANGTREFGPAIDRMWQDPANRLAVKNYVATRLGKS